MHGPSSLLALVACLSLTTALPANDRRAVVTVTKTYFKSVPGATVNAKPAPAKAQVFKEAPAPAPAPAAATPPEEKKPSPTTTPPPPTTTSKKEEAAPAPTKPAGGSGGNKGPTDPNSLTIQVTNKMNVPIMTVPGSNAEVAHLVKSNFAKEGSLASGEDGEIVVPMDWAGRIAVMKEGTKMSGKESLIEASFHASGSTIDVSFVDGWTVPIVCSCDGKPQSGCTDDLLSMKKCPMPFAGGCQNPNRGTTTSQYDSSGAHDFLSTCQGAAYTWDTDDTASVFGTCKGTISCCVGTAEQGCPAYNKAIKNGGK